MRLGDPHRHTSSVAGLQARGHAFVRSKSCSRIGRAQTNAQTLRELKLHMCDVLDLITINAHVSSGGRCQAGMGGAVC